MLNKLKIINDPVHGFIKIPYEIIFDVMEHPYFQRLRRIGQTGLLSLIFPGATHTRFHHALGAMHLMFTALETLKLKGVAVSEEEEKAAMLAILLHDIGHGPYSHALESILLVDTSHEELSRILMQQLNTVFAGELTLALQMFDGIYHRPFFHQLISSQLDVDRLDYLKRDSFYTGVAEGNINTQRILSMLNVCDERLVVDEKGIYSIENFLTSRMFMYWQVYFHKTSAMAEQLLVKVLQRAKELVSRGVQLPAPENLAYFLARRPGDFTPADFEKFTSMDDTDVMHAMKAWCTAEDTVLRYLCQCIVERRFPHVRISGQPFAVELSDAYAAKSRQYFSDPDAGELVLSMTREVKPYEEDCNPIFLMGKDKSIFPLPSSNAQLISGALLQSHTRYILAWPREIAL